MLVISDFTKFKDIPTSVADKIYKYHLFPLMELEATVYIDDLRVSQKSGYRPRAYEISKGRSGNSQHNFEGKGAVDLTWDDTPEKLAQLIWKQTDYTRICAYPHHGFIHCDYKTVNGGGRQKYIADRNKNWKRVEKW